MKKNTILFLSLTSLSWSYFWPAEAAALNSPLDHTLQAEVKSLQDLAKNRDFSSEQTLKQNLSRLFPNLARQKLEKDIFDFMKNMLATGFGADTLKILAIKNNMNAFQALDEHCKRELYTLIKYTLSPETIQKSKELPLLLKKIQPTSETQTPQDRTQEPSSPTNTPLSQKRACEILNKITNPDELVRQWQQFAYLFPNGLNEKQVIFNLNQTQISIIQQSPEEQRKKEEQERASRASREAREARASREAREREEREREAREREKRKQIKDSFNAILKQAQQNARSEEFLFDFTLSTVQDFKNLYLKYPSLVLQHIRNEMRTSTGARPSLSFLLSLYPLFEWMTIPKTGKMTPLEVYAQDDKPSYQPWGSFFGTTPVAAGCKDFLNSLSNNLYNYKVKKQDFTNIKEAFEHLSGRMAELVITGFNHLNKHALVSDQTNTPISETDHLIALMVLYYFWATEIEEKDIILKKLNHMVNSNPWKKEANVAYIRTFIQNATESLERARLQESAAAPAQATSDDICTNCLQDHDNCTCEGVSADAYDESEPAPATLEEESAAAPAQAASSDTSTTIEQKLKEAILNIFNITQKVQDADAQDRKKYTTTDEYGAQKKAGPAIDNTDIETAINDFKKSLQSLKDNKKIEKLEKRRMLNEIIKKELSQYKETNTIIHRQQKKLRRMAQEAIENM